MQLIHNSLWLSWKWPLAIYAGNRRHGTALHQIIVLSRHMPVIIDMLRRPFVILRTPIYIPCVCTYKAIIYSNSYRLQPVYRKLVLN